MSNASDFVIENGVLKKYVGPGGEVIVPGTSRTIGERAFLNRDDVTGIVLPEGIRTIQKYAFEGTSLKSVSIPNSLKRIDFFAFAKCSKLETFQVPNDHSLFSAGDGVLFDKAGTSLLCCPNGKRGSYAFPLNVKKIEASAFSYCTELTEIMIPQSVETIGECAFAGCESLEKAIIQNVTQRIAAHAFLDCKGLKQIEIPESVTSIGYEAFANCSGLERINLPDSVQAMEARTFVGCRCIVEIHSWNKVFTNGLKDCSTIRLYFNGSLSEIPPAFRPQALRGFAYESENSIDPAVSVSYLEYAKKNIVKLCPVAIDDPTLLTFLCNHDLIPAKAVDMYFQEAENRAGPEQKVRLLDYLNKLGTAKVAKAREKTEKAKEAYENAFIDRVAARDLSNGIVGMVFANDGGWSSEWKHSKKAVQGYLESYGAKLTESVTRKTDYLVAWDINENTNKVLKAKELGVPIITETDFNDMIGKQYKDAQRIEVSGWIRHIPDRAFSECKSVESIVIPKGVISIGVAAFKGCGKMKRILIPESVGDIKNYPLGEHAFSDCPNLTIRAPAGSYAEQYAKNYNIPFEAE